ncbi:MAG: 3-methyladenine DNA glycosylase [Rhodobacteraceae bacterium]|nr:3-methyladenine DNA glycosylase [Paracoccaceae bacterium]
MRTFDELFEIAAERKGGAEVLETMLDPPLPPEELARISDDRWLSQLSKNVFSAGFNWKVIENKWPGFEAAFKGFDVAKCAMMDDTWFDRLITDTSIVRHGAKIQTVRDNAVMLQDLAAEHGSAARALAHWPNEDYAGLLELLKRRGSRLGGNTGAYAMRFIGRDGYILSRDVVARLTAEGIIDRPPSSKTAMRQVQQAFNIWAAASGRSLKDISRVLAMSVG